MAKIIRAKKPPCFYCSAGVPHGGGVIDTDIVFRSHHPRVIMPYCNWPWGYGRSAFEIISSISAANPKLKGVTSASWGIIANHLDTVNPS